MKTCLYCNRRRKLNARLTCRECQQQQDGLTYSRAVTALIDGTGEEEDAAAIEMWDILDGHPARQRRKGVKI